MKFVPRQHREEALLHPLAHEASRMHRDVVVEGRVAEHVPEDEAGQEGVVEPAPGGGVPLLPHEGALRVEILEGEEPSDLSRPDEASHHRPQPEEALPATAEEDAPLDDRPVRVPEGSRPESEPGQQRGRGPADARPGSRT